MKIFIIILLIYINSNHICSKDKPFIINENCYEICPTNTILNFENKNCETDKKSCLDFTFDENINEFICINCKMGYFLNDNICIEKYKKYVLITPSIHKFIPFKKDFSFKILVKINDDLNNQNIFDEDNKYLIELKINKINFIKNDLEKYTIYKAYINKDIINDNYVINRKILYNFKSDDIFEFIFLFKNYYKETIFIKYFYFKITSLNFNLKFLDQNFNPTDKLQQDFVNYLNIYDLKYTFKEKISIKLEELYYDNSKYYKNILFYENYDISLIEKGFNINLIPSFLKILSNSFIKYKITIKGNNNFKYKFIKIENKNIKLLKINLLLMDNKFYTSDYLFYIYNVLKNETGFNNFIEGFYKIEFYFINRINFIKNRFLKNNNENYFCHLNCNYPDSCEFNSNLYNLFNCKCQTNSYIGKLCKTSKYHYDLVNSLFNQTKSINSSFCLSNIIKLKILLIISEYFDNKSYFKDTIELVKKLLNKLISFDLDTLKNIINIIVKINILKQILNYNLNYDFDNLLLKNIKNNIKFFDINNYFEYDKYSYNLIIFKFNYMLDNKIRFIKKNYIIELDEKLFKKLILKKEEGYYFIFIFNYINLYEKNETYFINNVIFEIIDKNGNQINDNELYKLITIKYKFENLFNIIGKNLNYIKNDNKKLKNNYGDISLNKYNKSFIKDVDQIFKLFNLFKYKINYEEILLKNDNENILKGNLILMIGYKIIFLSENYVNLNANDIFKKKVNIKYEFILNDESFYDAESKYLLLYKKEINHYNSYLLYIYINLGIFAFFSIIIMFKGHKKIVIINQNFLLIKEYEKKIISLRNFINFQSIVIVQLLSNYCSRFERFNKLLLLILNLHFNLLIGFCLYIIIYPLYNLENIPNLEINIGFSFICIIFSQIFTSILGYYFNYLINISKKIKDQKIRKYFKELAFICMMIILLLILFVSFSLIYEIFSIFEIHNYNSETFLFLIMFEYSFDILLLNLLEFLLSYYYIKFNKINIFERKLFYRGFSLYDQNDFILEKFLKEKKKFETFFQKMKDKRESYFN